MAIKVYISGISGNKEVKKRQQRVLMILDSKNIKYEVVDIAEPGNEELKEFMQSNSKCLGATIGDANPKYPLPPQLFNDKEYCGDYDQFDLSNEIDEIEKFLKLPYDDSVTSTAQVKIGNGEIHSESVTNGNEAEAKDQPEETEANNKLVDVEDDQVTSSVNENDSKQEEDITEDKEEESKTQAENVEPEEKMDSKNDDDDENNDDSNTREENEDVSKEKGDDNVETKLENEADSKEKNDSDESEDDSETKVEKEEKEDA